MSGSYTVMGVFAFSCGAILLYRLEMLPVQVSLLAAGAPALLWISLGRRFKAHPFFPLVAGLGLGFAWAGLWAHERLEQRLPEGVEGERVQVSGYVCGLPSKGSFNSIRFSFCVDDWYGLSLTPERYDSLPSKLRLAFYGQADTGLPDYRLRLEVVLKKPHGALNPEGFRYEDWLFRKGFRATGSVKSAVSDPSVTCSLNCQYHRLYARLAQWVDERFGGAGQHPLIASLLIGNRGYLSPTHWDVLKATGTIHLVAISGLHLGLVALGVGFLARRLLLAVTSFHLSEAFVRLAVFTTVLCCCLMYALAAGFTVPTRRALLMVTAGSWVLLKARQMPAWHSFVMALGLVLLLDPFAPLDQGFWLSFGAVSVLILVFAGRLGGSGWLAGLLLAQGAVFAGLWPFLEMVGQGQPVAGLLANILAIPWLSLVVMPVLLSGGVLVALFPGLSEAVVPVMDAVLDIMWGFLGWVAGMSWPDLTGRSLEIAGFAMLTLLVLTIPFGRFRVAGGVILLSWALAASLPGSADNTGVSNPEVRVWDVGQGLSAMVRAGNEVLLYDTGPEVKGVFSAAESVVIPNLKSLGVTRIDTLVISHADNDHAGGLARILDQFDVGRIVTGEPVQVANRLDRGQNPEITECGGEVVLGGELELLYWRVDGDVKGNDASCVLAVRQGALVEWLFPGDISARVETLYLRASRAQTAANKPHFRVVIAPHHGSKTSSSEAWVAELSPHLVIYTAGYRHRYGHPHRDVTARYRAAGSRAINTACSGSLMMQVVGGEVKTTSALDSAPFWIAGAGQTRAECDIP